LEENPDHVVLATGSVSIVPEMTGLTNALIGEDVLAEKKEIGHDVLIVGGGMVGLETAAFLAQRGHHITLVEMLDEIGRGMEAISRKLIIGHLEESNVNIRKGIKSIHFERGSVYVGDNGGISFLGNFETIVMAVGAKPVNDLEKPLQNKGITLHVIGDARKPGNIIDAVQEGYSIGLNI
jgi:pyruvate/2-oxoglutarate dehydrogenase complex dihydrolipoamide dehydrogenase (E3) component